MVSIRRLAAVPMAAVVVALSLSAAPVVLAAFGSWTAGPDLPSVDIRAVGVYFPDNGKFYAMGGRTSDAAGSELTNPVEYDPVTNTWSTKTATYPDVQVNNMACAVLNDSGSNYIYCVGGSAATSSVSTSRVFRYDPLADVISSVAAPWPA